MKSQYYYYIKRML